MRRFDGGRKWQQVLLDRIYRMDRIGSGKGCPQMARPAGVWGTDLNQPMTTGLFLAGQGLFFDNIADVANNDVGFDAAPARLHSDPV
jgi:hypothetical protein